MSGTMQHYPQEAPPAQTTPSQHASPQSPITIPRTLRRKEVPRTREKPKSKSSPVQFRFPGLFSSSERTYFNLTKRTLTLLVLTASLLLLALILGLSIGLSLRSKKAQNLPLPSSSQHFTGDLTYYAPALGACGITSSSSDSIVAVSHILFDAVQTGSDPNANPLCGLKIRATRFKDGAGERSADLTVVDRCTGCKVDDLDTTETVFGRLADVDQGRVTVTWAWLNPVPTAA